MSRLPFIATVILALSAAAALAASQPPVTGAISPASGDLQAGAVYTFTATFDDPDGYEDIADCRVLLNTAISGANGIFVFYDAVSNKLFLRNDNNTAWLGGYAPGSAGSMDNSRCAVYCSGSSVSGSGNRLTVNLRILLKGSLGGTTLSEWLYAGDRSKLGDGWDLAGSIRVVASPKPPVTGTISPSAGHRFAGVTHTFTATFDDPEGFEDIRDCRILLNTELSGANGIFIYFDIAKNRVYLRSDNNTAWLGGYAPGTPNTIENGRCRVYCAGTSLRGSGTRLTVTLQAYVKAGVAGKILKEWLYAGDKAGAGYGWNQAGALYMVAPAPMNTSVSPSSGRVSAPGWTTITTAQYDPNGFADIRSSYLLINSSFTGLGAVYVWYDAVEDLLYLRNDANTGWLGGFAPGSENIISNGRADLDCAATTVQGSAETLTVGWRVNIRPPQPEWACGAWMYAADTAGLNSGFEKKGDIVFDQAPTNASLEPAAGDALSVGQPSLLTAKHTDPSGAADIRGAYLVLNTTLSSFRGVSLWYDAGADRLWLRNDLNTAWLGGIAPGTAGGVIENGYCTIDCAGTTVERSGADLVVNWKIEPKASLRGKALGSWMYCVDAAGLSDGWDQMTTYTIGSHLNVSLTPSSGEIPAQQPLSLTAECLVPNGAAATSTYLLLNTTVTAANGVYLYYDGPGNRLYLRDDAGSAWLGGFAPGSANTIANSLVTVNCAGTTVQSADGRMRVAWSLEFKAAAARQFTVWMYTSDTAKLTDGWDTMGVLKVVNPDGIVYIPAGPALVGSIGDEPYAESDELPRHEVYLAAYWIGRTEVTRAQYRAFMDSGGYHNPAYWSSEGWTWKMANDRAEPDYWAAQQDWGGSSFTQTEAHPVVGVTYYEAEAYCAWAGGHLPTEAQWEKAARWTGSAASAYPWGDVWDPEKCNNFHDRNLAGGGYQGYQTAAVGSYPAGASPYGCQDMAGNAWEWCQDWYVSYPGGSAPFDFTGAYRVVRGGGWDYGLDGARSANRAYFAPINRWNDCGFRLAK